MKEETSKETTRPAVTRLLFGAILLCYLLMHIDDGILSVASEYILHDLQITESQLGLVEAAMYVGILAGSLVAPFMFAKVSPKAIIIVSVICNAASVGSWALTGNYLILAGTRILNGVFLVSSRSLFHMINHVIYSPSRSSSIRCG